MKPIALLAEFRPTFKPHIVNNAALEHSSAFLGIDVEAIWVSTEQIEPSLFSEFSGIWVAPGSPYKNLEKTLWAICAAGNVSLPPKSADTDDKQNSITFY